jgi:hypothetical protein
LVASSFAADVLASTSKVLLRRGHPFGCLFDAFGLVGHGLGLTLADMDAPAVHVLTELVDMTRRTVGERLAGLTEQEFLWEPAPNSWTVRPRDDFTSGLTGTGPFMYDYALPDPEPPPVTTIAWRLVHLASINDMYHEHVFGPGERDYPDQVVPGTAATALTWWQETFHRFRDALAGLRRDEDLSRVVGAPWGDTRTVAGWAEVFVYENIHHGAEIGCLRDVFRSR